MFDFTLLLMPSCLYFTKKGVCSTWYSISSLGGVHVSLKLEINYQRFEINCRTFLATQSAGAAGGRPGDAGQRARGETGAEPRAIRPAGERRGGRRAEQRHVRGGAGRPELVAEAGRAPERCRSEERQQEERADGQAQRAPRAKQLDRADRQGQENQQQDVAHQSGSHQSAQPSEQRQEAKER